MQFVLLGFSFGSHVGEGEGLGVGVGVALGSGHGAKVENVQ